MPRIYRRAIEILWLAVIFLLPLFFNTLSHQAFYPAKALLLQFLVMVMLGFWVAWWLLSRTGHSKLRWHDILNSPLHLSILVFGLLTAVSTAASIMPAGSFWGDYSSRQGLLTLTCWILFFLVVAQQLRHREQVFRALYVLLLSSGIVSVVGILQSFFPGMIQGIESTGRVFSTIGNELSLSCFLAMVVPFNLALIVYSWRKKKEGNNLNLLIILIVLLALQLWCLALAQYSITILLFAIGPIIFITLLGIVRQKKLIAGFGVLSLFVLGIIAGLLLIPILSSNVNTKTPETVNSSPSFTAESVGLTNLPGRVMYWRSAIDIVVESPEIPLSNDKLHCLRRFIGYGPETYIITFQRYVPPDMQHYGYLLQFPFTQPENHYLYLATTVGILGLISFLSIIAVFFYLCYRYVRRAAADVYKLLLLAMMAGVIQYMAYLFFNPSSLSPELVFWLILCFVPVIGRLTTITGSERIARESIAEFAGSKHQNNKVRRYFAAVCAALLILIGFGITAGPFMADMYLQRGFNLQAKGSDQALFAFETAAKLSPEQAVYWHCLGLYDYAAAYPLKEGTLKTHILTLSADAFEKARQLEPYIVYRNYVLADFYTYWAKTGATDKWPLALSLYDIASQLVPDNSIILDKWALALIVKGDFGEAQEKLDNAAQADPNWQVTSFFYGLLLAREGKNDEAAAKIIKTIEQNPRHLNSFIDSCRQLITYDMVSPLRDALEIYTSESPDDWIGHYLLGITALFDGNVDESLGELNSSVLLVPDDYTGYVIQAIYRLSTMSPNFQKTLPAVAIGWKDKLAQSPDRDTLLPLLNQLVNPPH